MISICVHRLRPFRNRSRFVAGWVCLLSVACHPRRTPENVVQRTDKSGIAELIPTGAGPERCPLPPKSRAQSATIVVRVMVLADGTPQHAEVTRSSIRGEGFEEAARKCAMNYRYRPAKDPSGQPLRAWSHEFNVKFVEIDAAASTTILSAE